MPGSIMAGIFLSGIIAGNVMAENFMAHAISYGYCEQLMGWDKSMYCIKCDLI